MREAFDHLLDPDDFLALIFIRFLLFQEVAHFLDAIGRVVSDIGCGACVFYFQDSVDRTIQEITVV